MTSLPIERLLTISLGLNVFVPVVIKTEYQLLSITDDGFLRLSNVESRKTKDDVKMPDDLEMSQENDNLSVS